MHPLTRTLIGVVALVGTAAAQAAPMYTFTKDDPPGKSGGTPDIQSFTTSFDHTSDTLSVEYTIDDDNDSFWLVVTPSDNPKDIPGEYAILYGDLGTTNATGNQGLWAYVYNGNNNPGSYANGIFLGAEIYDPPAPGTLVVSGGPDPIFDITPGPASGTQTVSFSLEEADLDTSGVAGWAGLGFQDTVGIWFHAARNSSINGDANGITSYTFDDSDQNWYDTSNKATTPVPAPATLPLFALGLLVLRRRRTRTAASNAS